MSTPQTLPAPGVRSRLLAAADELFYAEGIHAVGIDRVIAEAGAAKASLYHHFGGKDGLVVAYLDARSERFHAGLGARLSDAGGPARARIGRVFDGLWESASGTSFHGCPFINAAAEYPTADHPVRDAVRRHRERFASTLGEQLRLGGTHPDPALVTALTLAYDGAMVTAQVESPRSARAGTEAILDALLGEASTTAR
ncbi:TetR/AcrR family transcriptional regulator [Paraoerskovia marina]|uniref:TetR/AcrR family transcriptional regulator n=1 Tax=Paraoerskovia marina TaxID=545619 RepID=UPI0004929FD7|nr:TetR/AcrR family transcriptional regulator [Paraoerskovia marina]